MELADPHQVFGKQLVRKLLLPLVLSVLAYSALLLYGDAHAVMSGFRALRAPTLLVGLGLSLAGFFMRAVRWDLYLRRMGIRVAYSESARVFLAGLGMSITPGKVGEVLKPLLLKQHSDVPVTRSMPIVIAERLLDLAALLVLGTAGFLGRRASGLAVLLSILILLGFFAVGRSRRLGVWLVELVARIPRVSPYREKLSRAHESLYELWSPKTYALAIAASLVSWQLQASIVVVFARDLTPVRVTLLEAAAAYSAPLLAGTLALLPGGLGLTEASMAGTLQGFSGLSPSAATTLTILIRGVTFWLAVVIGFVSLASWRVHYRRAVADRNA